MAAVAVHVVNNDVVAACDGYAVVLVDHDAVANLSVIGRSKIKAITVMRGR